MTGAATAAGTEEVAADGHRVVPLVDYLHLRPAPHLVAHECRSCGARYFDHRVACANCSGRDFRTVDLPVTGRLRTFTIVEVAPPGVAVPFVAGVVDCGTTPVRANVVNVPPSPEAVRVGMPLRLCTFSLGLDPEGVEAVGFAFEPAGGPDDAGHPGGGEPDGG